MSVSSDRDEDAFRRASKSPWLRRRYPRLNAIDRLRSLTLWVTLAMLGLAVLMLATAGVSTDIASFGSLAKFGAAALLASLVLADRGKWSRFGDWLGAQGLIALSGSAGGLIALLGLHHRFPLIDRQLLTADRALGLDSPAFVKTMSETPDWLLQIIGATYTSTLGLLIISIGAIFFTDNRLEGWRAAFCFAGSLLTICLISILAPAKGVGMWIGSATVSRLPEGAARYFWPTFDRFYSGAPVTIHLESIDAVVSFPSFHIVMGLIAVAAWRRRPVPLAIASALFLIMAAGTVPFGGHYFVDLIAGAAIWMAWFGLSVRLAYSAQTCGEAAASGDDLYRAR